MQCRLVTSTLRFVIRHRIIPLQHVLFLECMTQEFLTANPGDTREHRYNT